MIGHQFYILTELLSLRSTGIGCYFDDPTHKVLRLHSQATVEGTLMSRFQSLYHFAVGSPVLDERLVETVGRGYDEEVDEMVDMV